MRDSCSSRSKCRWLSILLISLYLVVPKAFADGRYNVVPLHPGVEFGTEKALILDTVAGHMWIWVESPAVGDRDGGRYIIYQGQLTPGREMGDIILEQTWQSNSEKR